MAWPSLSFKDAKLIVSFGADFLEGWGASVPQQLDFADARAKLAGAPRFVYIGPRRSLTGLNADEWIACKPGSELAIANALAGKGSIQRGRDRRAVSTPRRCSVLPTSSRREAGARAVRRDRRQRARRRARRRGDQPGVGRGRHDDQASAADHVVRRNGAHRPGARRRRADARAGRSASRSCAACNPALLAAEGGQVRRGVREGRRSRVSFSSYPDETTELCDLIIPDLHSLESWGDAEPVRGTIVAPAAGDGSGLRRNDGQDGRRACSPWRRRITSNGARSSAAPDYRSWLIADVPGRRARRSPPRCRRASAPGTLGRATATVAAAPAAAAEGAGDRQHAGRFLPRHVSVAGARRRTRREQAVAPGAARSGHEDHAGARGSSCTPRRRSGSASIAATSSRSRRRTARSARQRSHI